jgi:hypothetical protein
MKKKPKGLGDSLHNFFKYTGIAGVVKRVNKDCNCDKRRDKLNELWKYKR